MARALPPSMSLDRFALVFEYRRLAAGSRSRRRFRRAQVNAC
jgi:hypothetical protein